ncbi:MAG: creatininase family protein [bacterium]|nr:creatininase family protein [bacterium]
MLIKNTDFKRLAESIDKLPVMFIASIEQHGPFLPLGTDTLIAEALSERLEQRMGDKVILLPTLPFGCSKEHKGFPGTISLECSTYISLIKEITSSIFDVGFDQMLVVSTHGGNNAVMRVIQNECNYGNKKKLGFLVAFDEEVDKKCQELFGGSEMHAGSSESSIIAALDPKNVGFIGTRSNPKFAPHQEGVFSLFSTKEITRLGILNFSPKLEIDPEKGKQLLEFIADNLVQKLKKLTGRMLKDG